MPIENRRSLEVLRTSLGESTQGNGRLVLITGGLATGKSTLLQEFCGVAARSEVTVLSAMGARTESDLRMGIVWQLLHSAAHPHEALDRASRLISVGVTDRETSESATGELGQDDVLTSHTLCSLLLELSRERPLVLVIDDLHFADTVSLQVLLFLQRRLRSARILIVLSSWDLPGRFGPVVHPDLIRHPHRRLLLGQLATEEIAHLVPEAGRDPAARERLAADIRVLSGGNPLLVQALLEDNPPPAVPAADDARPAEAAPPVAGEAFRQAVIDCLYRWRPELMRIARGLAVLGELSTTELLGRLLDMPAEEISQVITILTKAGIVADGRLRRPEITAAVRETISPQEAAHLHALAAELLYERGAVPGEVARHLVRGDKVPGGWALRTLRQAAEQALADNDADRAVQCLELGLRECRPGPEELAFRCALVQAAWHSNPTAAARHIPSLYKALSKNALRPGDAAPVVRYLLWQGEWNAAARPLRSITTSTGPSRAIERSDLRLSYEWIFGAPFDRSPDAAPPGGGAAVGAAVDADLRGCTTLCTLWTHGASDALLNSAEHILQGRLDGTIPEAGAMSLLVLDHAGRHRRASHWHTVLSTEADLLNASTWQAVLAAVGADMALRRGDLAAAAEQARDALDRLPAQSWGVALGFPLAALVQAETAMGRYDEAGALLDIVLPEAVYESVSALHYLHARAGYNLAVGRLLTAMNDFERCGMLLAEREIDFPELLPWRAGLAEAHLQLGQHERAAELMRGQLDRLGPAASPRVRGCSLRLLAAAGSPLERSDLLREATELLESSGDRLELARALDDTSRLHHELGNLGQARMVARRAVQEAKACNTEVSAAQRDPMAAGRGPDGPVPAPARDEDAVLLLSEAERKVAALAASGHTNREIGRRLYITVSTVEQHLTRVYRKLNVRQRAELPAELTRDRIDAGR